MNKSLLIAALMCTGTIAQAEDVGTKGKYFVYNGTKYMTQGAESVSAPGQTGTVTGKGISGLFYPNGFGHFGYTSAGGASAGTAFSVDGSIVASGDANVNLAASKKLTVDVEADTTVNIAKTYKGLFVKVNDWSAVIEELNALAQGQPAGSIMFKNNFSVVGSVLYVTGYSVNSDITLNGTVALDLDAGKDLFVTGSVTGTGGKTDKLLLSDGSTIAYSLRHLCWQNRQIVDLAPDVIGKGRPRSCKKYK